MISRRDFLERTPIGCFMAYFYRTPKIFSHFLLYLETPFLYISSVEHSIKYTFFSHKQPVHKQLDLGCQKYKQLLGLESLTYFRI